MLVVTRPWKLNRNKIIDYDFIWDDQMLSDALLYGSGTIEVTWVRLWKLFSPCLIGLRETNVVICSWKGMIRLLQPLHMEQRFCQRLDAPNWFPVILLYHGSRQLDFPFHWHQWKECTGLWDSDHWTAVPPGQLTGGVASLSLKSVALLLPETKAKMKVIIYSSTRTRRRTNRNFKL